MRMDTREYVADIVDSLIEKMNAKETDNIIGIRHYNSLRISETEVEKYRLANPDINFFYHHFDTSDIDEPFAPFLSIIKQLIHRNDVDEDTFIEVCGGYSLQRHALSSYFNDEPVLREEEYIYNEIDFEYKKMCVAIVNMLGYFARQKKIIIVMNKLHRGSSSTVDILTEIANTGDNNIGVIFSYNDFAVCPEYMEKRWKSFIEYVDRHNNLKDWGFNTLLNQKYKSEPFDFYAGKMMEYIEKLEKMYNLVDLEQANFYAKVIHRKLILEEFNISPANKLLFYELYAKIAIYIGDTSGAIIACDAYEKQMQMYPSEIKKYKYYYLLTIIQLYSGQSKQAVEYAYRCKMAAYNMGTDYTKFRADLLEHMTLWMGWSDSWVYEQNYDVDSKLLFDAKKYNYINHLAHIYIYTMDVEPELFSSVEGIDKRLVDFNKGVDIAKDLGNTFLIMKAYRKNLMVASTNGYFKVAEYFITEKLQPLVLENNDKFQQANIYNDLGYNSCAVEKYDAANEYFKKALVIFIELDMEEYIGETLYNMAINCIMAHNYKRAGECLRYVIDIINIYNWESLRVAHVSKIFGLMAFCQIKLNDIYESQLNVNFADQFLRYIEDGSNGNKITHYWDDDLFLYHICKGMQAFNEGEYRKAEREYRLSYKYGGPERGGAAFYYSIYAGEIYKLYRKMGRNSEAEYEICKCIQFNRENMLLRRAKELECVIQGKEPDEIEKLEPFNQELMTDLTSVLEKSKAEVQFKLYQKKIQYMNSWLKLQEEEFVDTEHLINNSIVSLMNEFGLDKLVMVQMKTDDNFEVVFNNIGNKINHYSVKKLCDYFKQHHSVFAASKLNRNFFEYEQIAEVFSESHLCALIGVPLYYNEKLEAFIFGYILLNDGWGVTSNRILITNQEVNLFEFFFRNLMESVSRFEYKKEIREQNKELGRLNKELSALVIRDGLTGLLNRKGLSEYIDGIIKEGTDTDSQQLFVIYCDLDKFKLCNDTYGHTAGDVVLKEFARILSDACGYNGKAVRYGGDEFLLILKDTDKEKIKNIIDYIYKNIMNSEGFSEEISKQLGEHIYIEESNRVSTSIGVAGIEGRITAEIISELISRADKALYYVKEHGKGKSCFFEDIVSAK